MVCALFRTVFKHAVRTCTCVYCSFYDRDAPIYTMSRFLPPSKVLDAEISHAIIGDGCVIKSGAKVTNSIVGIRSLIGSDCIIEVRARQGLVVCRGGMQA